MPAVRDPLLAEFFDHVDARCRGALGDAIDAASRDDARASRAVAAVIDEFNDLGRFPPAARRDCRRLGKPAGHADLRAVRWRDDIRLAALAQRALDGARFAQGLLDAQSRAPFNRRHVSTNGWQGDVRLGAELFDARRYRLASPGGWCSDGYTPAFCGSGDIARGRLWPAIGYLDPLGEDRLPLVVRRSLAACLPCGQQGGVQEHGDADAHDAIPER